ncbi:unnamed protein product [Phyllotreta striolata]|uniref:Uncharacterized protein n=1 Tax=Phyllotreta striolata TaxID=444603 RepID=A0A9P0DTZ1_PHYSR|nr:unnamed protein product [Phyllotreta striolata]
MKQDKYSYLKPFQDDADQNPTSENFIRLGDAYMQVLEPDDALKAYERALETDPKNLLLIHLMGKALIKTHYFNRAVTFYKNSIKENDDVELKIQLSELYMNLKEYQKAELLLLDELQENAFGEDDDLAYLRKKLRLQSLLAQIQERSGNLIYAMKSLKDAMKTQDRIRKRLAVEFDDVEEEKNIVLDELSVKLGEMALMTNKTDQAINFYKEGLDMMPNNINVLVALAKAYMQVNNLDLCQQTCAQILKQNSTNETASLLLAEIALRKVDFDMAGFHFIQLVTKQPTNWQALARLIDIFRRMGIIEDSVQYLDNASKCCDSKDTKFLYCTALYQMYSGDLNGALRNFNNAKPDSKFGLNAIYHMIDICLNPEEEMFAQFMEGDDTEYKDSRTMAIKTAERLLRELKIRLGSNAEDVLKYRLLDNFRLLSTREKFNIERALDDFSTIGTQSGSKDNIGTILGVATAYTLLNQGKRAKTQLKRISTSPWSIENSEYLERSWLLLADYYIQASKYEPAAQLIKKILQHNKSCAKAHEYSGFVSEKEQKHQEAALHYEEAWKLGRKTNPAIGYKLASCLMKCKKYPKAIVTAQEVLKINPEYDKIRKDILEKSLNNLRI